MFTEIYANLYDSIHKSKDYAREVKQILAIIDLDEKDNLHGFDFGCGTGTHAAEFAKLGVQVDGFDVSEGMLSVAKSRYPLLKFSNRLDEFSNQYDFSYSLFDVLSYQTTIKELGDLLANLFSRTKNDGICIVDSWNLKGVLADPPKINDRNIMTDSGEVIRRVTPDNRQTRQGIYRLAIDLIESNSSTVLKSELHEIRAWSPVEVIALMEEIGFVGMSLYNPVDPSVKCSELDWRFGIKAKKP
jgi:SAM-dependent methyltransferase